MFVYTLKNIIEAIKWLSSLFIVRIIQRLTADVFHMEQKVQLSRNLKLKINKYSRDILVAPSGGILDRETCCVVDCRVCSEYFRISGISFQNILYMILPFSLKRKFVNVPADFSNSINLHNLISPRQLFILLFFCYLVLINYSSF